MTANKIGVVTVAGSAVGRRNRLHVPQLAAATATMRTPASISAIPLYPVTDAEAFFRAFHAARPAVTSRALARAGSYARLAAHVPRTGRILDLACGDSYLASLIGTNRVIGVDLAPARLPPHDRDAAAVPLVVGRAQQLPFADRVFSAATCHLAFMLFDETDEVVAELARVLEPGAPFLALLGGGPTADGADAFHAFAEQVPRGAIRFGDRRARSEDGWHELFRDDWRDITFERWELDLGGTFDEVWAFLGASYQLAAGEGADAARTSLRARFPGDHVPCRIATYVARVFRR